MCALEIIFIVLNTIIIIIIIAHGDCTDTIRESVLEDSGSKIPCRTWDSNPRQFYAWPNSRTLYPLSYRRRLVSRQERRENCFLQGQLFVMALIWGFRSTPVTPQDSQKDLYHSAKSAGGS